MLSLHKGRGPHPVPCEGSMLAVELSVRGGVLTWLGFRLGRSVEHTGLRFCIGIRDGVRSGVP